MENQINMGNQNSQQIVQNPMNRVSPNSGKPRINYWMITSLIFGALFLIITVVFILGLKFNKTTPIVSEPKISVVPTDIDNARVENEESYVDFLTCDQWTQYVIETKNLPRKMIHSCRSSQRAIGSEAVYLVDIFFGPPDDCPSGCIYKRFMSVVKPDKSIIEQLPSGPEGILNEVWAQPPLNTARQYQGFECPSQLDNYIDVTLAKLDTKYGWNLNFKNPLVCSWEEFDNIKQIVNKKSLTMDGSMFVYLENGKEHWNRNSLIVK